MLSVMKEMIAGIRSLALGWQVWVGILFVLNMAMPLIFIDRLEAQLTLAATLAGATIGMVLIKFQGYTRLLGLMHLFWIPLVIFLIGNLTALPATDPFGIWVRTLIVIDSVSLAIDFVDVVRYIRGERDPISFEV